MDKSKPFGLILPKRAQAVRAKISAVFDSDSDDEPVKKKSSIKIPQAKSLPKKLVKQELEEDPSIYEYDSIYDDMKAQKVAETAPKRENKPSRYIDTLLKAADKRKKEQERRVEKKVQKEREKEGDKFKDKEAFVTSAYKKKMQEMEEEEERERRENQINDMMDVTKQKDLSGFYRHFLKQSVGEEKIPEFGHKLEVKQEVQSEPEEDAVPSVNKISPEENEAEENLDRDSDIVSSSDEEPPKLSDSKHPESTHDDSVKEPPTYTEKNDLSRKRKQGEFSSRKPIKRNIRKRLNDEESESASSSNEDNEKQDDIQVDADSVGCDPEAAVDGKIAAESEKTKSKKGTDSGGDEPESTVNGKIDTESEKPKPKIDIFAKRTVGELFAEKQARYFQRMAARGE